MNFDLSPQVIAAADQAQAGVRLIVDKVNELTPLVLEAHGDRQKALVVIASAMKIALSGAAAPELIIAEMALQNHERRVND